MDTSTRDYIATDKEFKDKHRFLSIIEGHDPGACFWIQPVKCHSDRCFDWESVEECSTAEISLDEYEVDGLLKHFFFQFFDATLIYNQQRKAEWSRSGRECEPASFEWNLTHNFYTYASMRQMIAEIAHVADLLESDEVYSIPAEIYQNDAASLIDEDSPKDLPFENQLQFIQAHLSVLVDYYRRFACRIEKMLDENPEWPLISIMGP